MTGNRFSPCRSYFYPRPPRGGRRLSATSCSYRDRYFYPRPPRGGRRDISSDLTAAVKNFYPRPPRGGRPPDAHGIRAALAFLSTPSARRATFELSVWIELPLYFYPRPPRGGRPGISGRSSPKSLISIHALREEGDIRPPVCTTRPMSFLSTPSARRATF